SENGKQPMHNEDKTVWISYNGEIYNFQELKKELLKKNHIFLSSTDTEVIIHGYEEWGERVVEKLRGMFAFCIYDKKKKKLFIARDHIGIKPIYYYFKDEKLIFASEIKAILEHNIIREANKEAIIEYLAFQNSVGEKTFFNDIKLILPGEYLIYEDDKIKKVKYWKEKYEFNTPDDCVEEFSKRFENSVKEHLMSDVPVGAYTSSGFDSSSVTYFASKYNKNMHTFTGKFNEGAFYDEVTCVKKLAEKINVQQHDVLITPQEVLKAVEKIIYHLDEPKTGLSLISNYHIAKYASKHVKVVLTGHGGDELFLGYPVYLSYLLKSLMKKKPFSFFKALTTLKGEEFLRFGYFIVYPLLFDKDAAYGHFIIFNKKQRRKILTEEFYEQTKEFKPLSSFEKIIDEDIDELTRVQQIYFRNYLPSLMIVEDKMSMANSIEGRLPICDLNIVNFGFSLHPETRLRGMKLKRIIKDAMKGKLPDIFFEQQKRGFPTPFSLWLRKELKEYVYDILLSEKAQNRGVFNPKEVKKLLDKHCKRKTDYLFDRVNAARIWSLLSVELWFRIFIDRKL
ncbi:asparagine synthase (glutamine-hydrolyzing), partial [archaeon]|nr:asparagine synthase (glutamine-hydrolyzing) [archaeon]